MTSSLVEINCRHDTVNNFLGPLLQALSIDSCSCPIQFYCYLWYRYSIWVTCMINRNIFLCYKIKNDAKPETKSVILPFHLPYSCGWGVLGELLDSSPKIAVTENFKGGLWEEGGLGLVSPPQGSSDELVMFVRGPGDGVVPLMRGLCEVWGALVLPRRPR